MFLFIEGKYFKKEKLYCRKLIILKMSILGMVKIQNYTLWKKKLETNQNMGDKLKHSRDIFHRLRKTNKMTELKSTNEEQNQKPLYSSNEQ